MPNAPAGTVPEAFAADLFYINFLTARHGYTQARQVHRWGSIRLSQIAIVGNGGIERLACRMHVGQKPARRN
jgi:hypothetical protein